jgi:drug/metabolite transporter (DMT)-like permease
VAVILTKGLNDRRSGRILSSNKQLLAALGLLLAAVIWGSTYVLVKQLLFKVTPEAYLAIRFSISIPIVLTIFHGKIRSWWREHRTSCKATKSPGLFAQVFPGILLATAFATQAYGLRGTSPGTAAFLTSLTFCFVPLLEFLYGERQNSRHLILPLSCALIGTILITEVLTSQLKVEDALLLLCAMGYAGQIFFTSRVLGTTHAAIPFVMQGTVVLAIFSTWVILSSLESLLALSFIDVFQILYVALVATVLCFLLQFWAQRYIRPRYVGLIFTVEPVAALMVSAVLGHESLNTTVICGSAFILTAVILSIYCSTSDVKK